MLLVISIIISLILLEIKLFLIKCLKLGTVILFLFKIPRHTHSKVLRCMLMCVCVYMKERERGWRRKREGQRRKKYKRKVKERDGVGRKRVGQMRNVNESDREGVSLLNSLYRWRVFFKKWSFFYV